MKFKRRAQVEDSVNLTPLIDVVFLLLIFFMVSTTFTREARLEVILPEANAAPERFEPEQLAVTVDAEGHYAVNGQVLVDNQQRTLKAALIAVTGGDYTRPLVISADASARHELVVRVMDVAGQLGIVNLRIATSSNLAQSQRTE